MAKRFWLLLVAVLFLAAGAWMWAARAHHAAMRMPQAEPAAVMPAQPVAVTAEGKQFHDPSCKFIHGKVQMMTAQQAAAEGYTPDPRCMRKALQK